MKAKPTVTLPLKTYDDTTLSLERVTDRLHLVVGALKDVNPSCRSVVASFGLLEELSEELERTREGLTSALG